MSFKNTCRTCLHTGGIMVPMFQINLTDTDSPAISIVDLLKMFTKILIYQNDEYPQQMCITCLEEIKRVFEFKVKCERSERNLTTMLQNQRLLLLPIGRESNNTGILRQVLINANPILAADKAPPLPITNENLAKISPSGSTLFNANDKIGIERKTGVEKAPQKSKRETYSKRILRLTSQKEDLCVSQKPLTKIAPKFSSVSPIGLPNGNLIPIMPFNTGINCGGTVILQPIPFDPSGLIPSSNFQVIPLSNLIQMGNYIANTNSVEIPKQFSPPGKSNVNSGSLQAQISTGPANKQLVVDNVKNDHDYLANSAVDDSNASKTMNIADESEAAEEFECPGCSVKLMNVKILKQHFIAEHMKETICLICNRKNIVRKYDHVTGHMEKKYFCIECKKGFPCRASHARHLKRYSDKSRHECIACEKKFCIESDYRRHWRRHTRPKSFVCQICDTAFCSNRNLLIHRAKQHDINGFECDLCDRTFKTRVKLSWHAKFHSSSGPVKCEICQRTYPRVHNLKDHQRRCHSGRTYTLRCSICPRKFKQKADLTNHLKRMHSESDDINDRRCDICFKVMSHKIYLINHMRTHSNIRPFKCEICQRTFRAKPSLKSHLIFHSSERPCKCQYCRLSFKTRANLNQHKKALHKIEYQREIEDREAAKKAQAEIDLVEKELVHTTCEQRRHAVRSEHLDSVLSAAK